MFNSRGSGQHMSGHPLGMCIHDVSQVVSEHKRSAAGHVHTRCGGQPLDMCIHDVSHKRSSAVLSQSTLAE
jgi:hypothetical protein